MASNHQDNSYSRFTESTCNVVLDEAEALGNKTMYSNHWFAAMVATFTGILFVGSSIAFADELAQEWSKWIPGIMYWFPFVAAIVSILLLFCQAGLSAIPFRRWVQRPIVEQYCTEGFPVVAHRIEERSKSNRVTIMYRPDPDDFTIYTKEVYVEVYDHKQTEFPIVVLPDMPTSAILQQKYQRIAGPGGSEKIMCRYGMIPLLLWLAAAGYVGGMALLSRSDVWQQWGFLWLFGISVVSSLCWGYVTTVSEVNTWLYGDSQTLDDYEAAKELRAQCCQCLG